MVCQYQGCSAWTVDKEWECACDFGGTVERDEKGFKVHFTARDLWFTTRDKAVYAIGLVWPEDGRVLVKSMA